MRRVLAAGLSLAIVFIMAGTGLADLNDGLVAYYPFNGNADDESGNGNDGTVNGAILTTDRFGNQNSAYKFDGISNDIRIPDKPSQQISTNRISISAWITLEKDIPNTQWRVVNKQSYGQTSWGLELYGNGYEGGQGNNLTFHNSDGNRWVACVASEASLVREQHIMLSQFRKTMRLKFTWMVN